MDRNVYVHLGSGLVVMADECVTIDLDSLPDEIVGKLDGDDYVDDQTLYEYACGISITDSSREE